MEKIFAIIKKIIDVDDSIIKLKDGRMYHAEQLSEIIEERDGLLNNFKPSEGVDNKIKKLQYDSKIRKNSHDAYKKKTNAKLTKSIADNKKLEKKVHSLELKIEKYKKEVSGKNK